MKKVYFLLCALAVAGSSFAQTISNAGMEYWRTGTSGTAPIDTIHAPVDWYSGDSLTISLLEAYGALLYMGYTPTNLHSQLFQDSTVVYSGSTYSAKLVSVKQDTAGILPGSLINAQPAINLTTQALTYIGGTATNLRITTVNAWVEYFPGKDSITGIFGGNDSGSLTVQAISSVAGSDSVVGTGTFNIGTESSWTQIAANVVYIDTVDLVYEVRIFFSSGKTTGALDSSIMYVDDVSMVGDSQTVIDNGVHGLAMGNDLVKVYPNPATETIYLDGAQNAGSTCLLFSIDGQIVATKSLTGRDMLDVSYLPAGFYFYSIIDANANRMQSGKVAITR